MDSPTATAKRKRTDAGADMAAAQAVEEVSDAEVEEFYAILRRMRDASRRFVSSAGTGAGARGCHPGPVRAPAWRPSFSLEDFAPPAPPTTTAASHQHQHQQQHQLRPPSDERVAENATPPPPRRPAGVSLDLNAEPEPEAPATPCPQRVHA